MYEVDNSYVPSNMPVCDVSLKLYINHSFGKCANIDDLCHTYMDLRHHLDAMYRHYVDLFVNKSKENGITTPDGKNCISDYVHCDRYRTFTSKVPRYNTVTGQIYEYVPTVEGRCMGTKELDVCACNGNKKYCDFYEHVRKEGNKIG